MKIYTPEPNHLVRIQIRRAKEKTFYLTFYETTQEEVINFVKDTIKSHASPFPVGTRTAIDIRKAIGSKNLKSKSISFYGLTTEATYKLIIKAAEELAHKNHSDLIEKISSLESCIEQEAKHRQLEGAETASWEGGSRWMLNQVIDNLKKALGE